MLYLIQQKMLENLTQNKLSDVKKPWKLTSQYKVNSAYNITNKNNTIALSL